MGPFKYKHEHHITTFKLYSTAYCNTEHVPLPWRLPARPPACPRGL